jgi:anti-sigma regulatory factor (Ser/Thr protein kinase)
MTPDAPLAGPAIGSAWQPAQAGQPRPMEAGMLALVALPTSPFWARRYTRSFLDTCHGMSESTAETAELLVSELVTNAVRFSGDPARTLRYSERANASLISLSLRHFREGLLIEVYDTDSNPPIRSDPDVCAENGRGLMLVDALSKEWSYFFPPCGGKVVYLRGHGLHPAADVADELGTPHGREQRCRLPSRGSTRPRGRRGGIRLPGRWRPWRCCCHARR